MVVYRNISNCPYNGLTSLRPDHLGSIKEKQKTIISRSCQLTNVIFDNTQLNGDSLKVRFSYGSFKHVMVAVTQFSPFSSKTKLCFGYSRSVRSSQLTI